ncbi:hypothetical protein TrVFT333_007490 [Trichoderma virens FT-333]|nr:hypothetical protein TrVFT333_007490 [Trichoderma virens FT-333]
MDSNTFVVDDEQLSRHQIHTIALVERIGGIISLVSVMLIFLAYWLVRRVRNVQNTFIVFASVSNIGASIASIIAYDGMNAGQKSALCQAQAFMFQMFMQSDPWWSLAMAVNVFLVFYFHTNPDSFRKRWWIYCLICYGGPFTIALTLLLLRSPRGLVYGGATNREKEKDMDPGRAETGQNGCYGTVTTEVQVTHTPANALPNPNEPQPAYIQQNPRHVSFDNSTPEIQPSGDNQYYSSVTTSPPQEAPPRPPLLQRFMTSIRTISGKFHISDPIKRAYLRTSFLFALSVLVTWIPSSLNRIHGWLDGGSPYDFHVATAAVLPLQGLWNAIIFFVTSWRPIKAWAHETLKSGAPKVERRKTDDLAMNERITAPLGRCESFIDDGDSATIGSDVELRRVPNSGIKPSNTI